MTPLTRRDFIAQNLSAAAVAALAATSTPAYGAVDAGSKPAILGGDELAYDSGPAWPFFAGDEMERVQEVFESRHWCRAGDESCATVKFENEFGEALGAKYSIAVSSGTAALQTALAAHDIGPGDEVISTPYTYVATINSIIQHYGLPVFADIDPETYQVDPEQMESRVTDNTRLLLPVHIGGAPANLDAICEIGERRGVPVVEDACQAHLGEWRGKKLGTIGSIGCFSFQQTKNLAGGEGGAVVSDDEELAYKALDAHSHGFLPHAGTPLEDYRPVHASNYRMTGFQGAIMLAQLPHIAEQADIRNANAKRLAAMLSEIPGVYPQKVYEGGRSAWHLFMFRIDEEEFGLSRDAFVQAMNAEGVPLMTGYHSCDWVGYVRKTYDTRAGRRVYSKEQLDDWAEATSLPNFHKVANETAWLFQSQLLAPENNMVIIADLVRRIHKYASEIQKELA